MKKISAVIITKNEEKNIERCIQSLIGIVDEIIVLDSFSDDKTEEICKQYNVIFAQKEFKGYASAKNAGNDLANFPYIFSIDADEELSQELKTALLDAKKELNADAYTLNRRTNYCGKWIYNCGWYPDQKLRLWNKSKAKWTGEIHEKLDLKSSNIKHLKGDLLHYSYPNLESHARKINHFTDISSQEMFNKNKKASIFKLTIRPLFEFFKKYFLKKGFLDGYYGFVISVMSAYYIFYKYAKLRDLWNKNT